MDEIKNQGDKWVKMRKQMKMRKQRKRRNKLKFGMVNGESLDGE